MSEKDRYQRFVNASREIGIPVKKILDIFYYLKSHGPLDNNKLVQTTGVSVNVANKVKEYLKDFFTPVSNVTNLSSNGLEVVTNIFNTEYEPEESIISYINTPKKDEVESLLGVVKRVEPNRSYDQFSATDRTTANRASLMNSFADIKGKRLLFIGDDDLTSVATGLYHSAASQVVLDIDPRILQQINEISSQHELAIVTDQYDARLALPTEYSDSFDVVFIDPPYTTEGVKLFISRAVSALDKENQSARIYLCYGNSDRAKERYLPIYQVLLDSGLYPRWVFDKFNRYHGATSIGSTSTLFICDITPKTVAIIKGDDKNQIYTTAEA